jgi:glycosyltransferase involved in cell wall biosynthesis
LDKTTILVVGQTPPPYGGQAIMINNMLSKELPGIKMFHARMDFSTDMEEVGKFKVEKIAKLLRLILMIYYFRFKYGIKNLYYPPAPPSKVPMMRDIAILISCRWLFQNTIFHFHAAGISEMHKKLSGILRKAFERAYFNVEYAINISEHNPKDADYFKCKRQYLIPNGLADLCHEDASTKEDTSTKVETGEPMLLYVGVLTESKGIMVLLQSVVILIKRGLQLKVRMVGKFESKAFEMSVRQFVTDNGLEGVVAFTGVLTGKEKINAYSTADLFCFPTYFEAETFGLVALEAMQFGLPVVSTTWRGLPSIVRNGINGFTVPPKNAELFAEKVELLITNPALAKEMGQMGRRIYEEGYTDKIYTERIQNMFSNL